MHLGCSAAPSSLYPDSPPLFGRLEFHLVFPKPRRPPGRVEPTFADGVKVYLYKAGMMVLPFCRRGRWRWKVYSHEKPGPVRAMEEAKISSCWESSREKGMRLNHLSSPSFHELSPSKGRTWERGCQDQSNMEGSWVQGWRRRHSGIRGPARLWNLSKVTQSSSEIRKWGKCSLTPRDVWKIACSFNQSFTFLDIYPKEIDIWSKLYEQRSSS